MCLAGFDPYVGMLILMSSVVVMDGCMLMGPATGWSDTEEYRYLSQFQLPFAKNIIAYVLGKCENLVGVMVFGHKASENIIPWFREVTCFSAIRRTLHIGTCPKLHRDVSCNHGTSWGGYSTT